MGRLRVCGSKVLRVGRLVLALVRTVALLKLNATVVLRLGREGRVLGNHFAVGSTNRTATTLFQSTDAVEVGIVRHQARLVLGFFETGNPLFFVFFIDLLLQQRPVLCLLLFAD